MVYYNLNFFPFSYAIFLNSIVLFFQILYL